MLEELMFLNHWLKSKDPHYPQKYGITREYFISLFDIYDWVIEQYHQFRCLPTLETTAVEFEDFRIVEDLDSIDYIVNALRNQRAYMDYRPMLEKHAIALNEGQNALELMYQARNELEKKLKRYAGQITYYDWAKNALDRYEKYMEKHGKDGLAGLPTGISSLDELTGGWKEDDMILLAGRLNEGKSLLGVFFAYAVWRFIKNAGLENPVIYITTEMPELEVAYRLDTLRKHFSNRALNEGRLEDPQLYKEYLEELSQLKNSLLILSQESNRGNPFTPEDIHLIIDTYKPAFIVIDQLYDLVDGTNERDIRRRIVNVTSNIRQINLLTRTPIMLLAQAGRQFAKEAKKNVNLTPELEDVQESDNPAQKATKAITIKQIGEVFKLSVKKNRGGPKNKDVYLRSFIDTGFYEEITVEQLQF